MNIAPLTPQIRSGEPALDQLQRQPNANDAQKIAEIARQFEAVLLRQILADATKNMFKTVAGQESATNGIYQDMVTNSLADNMSRSGGLGLARVIATQLQHESTTAPAPVPGHSKV